MAKKSKEADTKEPTTEAKAITKLEAAQMLAKAMEMRALAAEANLAKLTHDVLLAKLDPKGLIAEQEARFRGSSSEYQTAKADYDAFRKTIGDRLGVDLSRYSYDEETGELFPLEN